MHAILPMMAAFVAAYPSRISIHHYGREKEVEYSLSCIGRWPTLSVKRHCRPHLPRGRAVARMSTAICAPWTDAADNTQATCHTVSRTKCPTQSISLGVSALLKSVDFLAASSCNYIWHIGAVNPILSLSFLYLTTWLSACMSLHHVYLSVCCPLSLSLSAPLSHSTAFWL